jgi:hypothetical protein
MISNFFFFDKPNYNLKRVKLMNSRLNDKNIN